MKKKWKSVWVTGKDQVTEGQVTGKALGKEQRSKLTLSTPPRKQRWHPPTPIKIPFMFQSSSDKVKGDTRKSTVAELC